MSSRPPHTFPDFDDVDTDPRAHLLLDLSFGEERPSDCPANPDDEGDDTSVESGSP